MVFPFIHVQLCFHRIICASVNLNHGRRIIIRKTKSLKSSCFTTTFKDLFGFNECVIAGKWLFFGKGYCKVNYFIFFISVLKMSCEIFFIGWLYHEK